MCSFVRSNAFMPVEKLQICLTTLVRAWAQNLSQATTWSQCNHSSLQPTDGVPNRKDGKDKRVGKGDKGYNNIFSPGSHKKGITDHKRQD